jgi:pentatricopeptide repeat protein
MYGKLIYLLLGSGVNAELAVKAVLSHLHAKGLEPSTHIYTMLVEHYFTRDPPDLAAVKSLIKDHRLHENKKIDRVFWERVIQGYCKVGDAENAFHVFEKIDSSGSTLTFSTLHDLLVTLGSRREMDSALKLLKSVRRYKEEALSETQTNPQTRFWKHRFWHRAGEFGLLQHDLKARFEAVFTS